MRRKIDTSAAQTRDSARRSRAEQRVIETLLRVFSTKKEYSVFKQIHKAISDFISSLLIYGFGRGLVRCVVRADRKKSGMYRMFRFSLKSDRFFRFVIRRLARASLRDWAPDKVYAESTNACNADCVMCNRHKMTRKTGVMEYALFKDIAGQCASLGVKEMRFHNFGEPMMDRLLAEKVRYAKKKGIGATALYSNGSLLNRTMADKLIESGLDRLFISFDGGTRETYERIRVKLNYDDVSENIERFMALRNRKERQQPAVELVLLPVHDDPADVQRFREKWEGKVDSVRVSRLHDFAGQNGNGSATQPETLAVPCYMLWKSMFILWNGDVSLCCLDFDGKYILGNVRKSSLEDIWRGEKFNTVRRRHATGELSELALCRQCHINHVRALEDRLKTIELWT
ncbi:MAG: radical SAM/SPASM domain-containing protein [Candidatus Zhuqueibacterota bacterium]